MVAPEEVTEEAFEIHNRDLIELFTLSGSADGMCAPADFRWKVFEKVQAAGGRLVGVVGLDWS